MRYQLVIPARINILGNPADGVEGAHSTISAAVDTYAGATVEPADGLLLESITRDGVVLTSLALDGLPPHPYDSILDLPKAAVNRLYTDGELSLWLLEAIGIVLTAKSCYTLACESSWRSVWSEGCSAGSRWPTNQLPGNEDQSV